MKQICFVEQVGNVLFIDDLSEAFTPETFGYLRRNPKALEAAKRYRDGVTEILDDGRPGAQIMYYDPKRDDRVLTFGKGPAKITPIDHEYVEKSMKTVDDYTKTQKGLKRFLPWGKMDPEDIGEKIGSSVAIANAERNPYKFKEPLANQLANQKYKKDRL